MAKAERQILIGAPLESVYEVITDYERYPEFLPEIKSTRVISRYEGVTIVKFDLDLIMHVSYTLRLAEYSPSRVVWSLEEAKLLTVNDGSWDLVDAGQGQTRATYSLDVVLGGVIPGSVSRRLLGPTLDETLHRFKARAESRLTQRIEAVR